MEKIGKNHEVIQFLKKIKKSASSEYIYTDDLEVLKLACAYSLKLPYVLYSYEQNYHDDTAKLLETLKQRAECTYEISDHTYSLLKTKENHIGILGVIQIPYSSLEEFKNKSFLVVLDHLELPGNIGTIYRTLDACKVDGVLLLDPISKRGHPKVTAAARGTQLIIPTVECTYSQAVDFLLEQNFQIYLGEPLLGENYQAYDYADKIAIVVGNERFGIQADWYQHPHHKVFIPMEGNNHSLNVSVAASILVYEAYMKRKNK